MEKEEKPDHVRTLDQGKEFGLYFHCCGAESHSHLNLKKITLTSGREQWEGKTQEI